MDNTFQKQNTRKTLAVCGSAFMVSILMALVLHKPAIKSEAENVSSVESSITTEYGYTMPTLVAQRVNEVSMREMYEDTTFTSTDGVVVIKPTLSDIAVVGENTTQGSFISPDIISVIPQNTTKPLGDEPIYALNAATSPAIVATVAATTKATTKATTATTAKATTKATTAATTKATTKATTATTTKATTKATVAATTKATTKATSAATTKAPAVTTLARVEGLLHSGTSYSDNKPSYGTYTFKAVEGAQYYEIYYAPYHGETSFDSLKWQLLGTTTTTKYQDKDAYYEKDILIKARAVSGTVKGEFSDVCEADYRSVWVRLTGVSDTTGAITLNWDKMTRSHGTIISVVEQSTGTTVMSDNVDPLKSSITITGLKSGGTYTAYAYHTFDVVRDGKIVGMYGGAGMTSVTVTVK